MCITLVIIAIVYNLLIDPVVSRWKTLNGQIKLKTVLIQKNTRLLRMCEELQDEYEKYQGSIKTSGNEEEELAKSLGEIENISQRSACYIENIRPRASKKAGKYREISLEVAAEGGIDEVSRFLYEIETSKQCLRVKRFTIIPKSGPQTVLKGTFLISKIIAG